MANPDGVLVDCNPACAKLLGFTSCTEAIQSTINILGANKRQQDSLRKRLQKTCNIFEGDHELKGASGHPMVVAANFTAVRDAAGAVTRIECVIIQTTTEV